MSSKPAARWLTWAVAIVMTAIVMGMLLIIAGFFHTKVPDVGSSETGAVSAEGFELATVKRIKQPQFETATGSVRPVHESSVASKILARVVELRVTAGQQVARDDVLVRLDDAEMQARLKQNEAALVSAQAQREKAVTDFGRAKRLKEQDAIALTEFDAANAALKSAEAAVERASQSVRESQIMLDYATIRSPMSGTVIEKRVEVGDTVVPGQVLLSLFDPTHMQMVASVRESLARNLTPGQKLTTRLDALNYECEATISEVVPESDVATRSFIVKVTGPCPPGAYSGMFGRLQLPLGEEQLLVLPSRAIQRMGQLTMVFVVLDGQLTRRYVRVGRMLADDQAEILAGLSEGETVALVDARR